MISKLLKPETPEQIRSALRVHTSIACLMAVLLATSLTVNYRLRNVETENDVLRPAKVAAFVDTILFDGDISTDSVAQVKTYLDDDKDKKLGVFYIKKSGGGNSVAADNLVNLLNEHKITIVFPNDSECISSCVLLFIHAKSREVRQTSSFGFHQGWVRQQDWSFRGVYHLLIDGNWPKKAEHMDDWAREISPDFLTFLEGCSSKPLRNENALVIPWSVISGIVNHTYPLKCDQGRKPPP